MTSALPFDDFRELLAKLPAPDQASELRVRDLFAKAGAGGCSLGRIEDIAAWLAEWSGQAPPTVMRPLVAVFAGNHGVARHGISRRPMSATAAAVELCAAGGAAVNQACIAHDLGLKVFDLALHLPTGDITEEAALDERGCAATMAFGMEALAGGTDLLCLGDLGIGNATVAATLFAAILGGTGADWVETGSDGEATMARLRMRTIDAALACHGAHLRDPLEALRRVGGREFAALAGAILAARMEKIPVLLGGHAALAAATVLHAVNPAALDHCRLAGLPGSAALARVAARLRLEPLLDLRIDHHGGVDSALAAGLVKAAALVSSGMAAAIPR